MTKTAFKLYAHQLEGVAAMEKIEADGARGGVLGDEMGLGKTITTVEFLRRNKIDGAPTDLIVAPMSLMTNWKKEIKRVFKGTGAPMPKILIYQGVKRDRKFGGRTDYDFIITTYDMVASGELLRFNYPKMLRFGRIVADESHMIKNGIKGKVKAALGLYELAKYSKRNWCITGTIFNNRIEDIASQAMFIGTAPYNSKEWWKKAKANVERVYEWQQKYLIRRTKDGLLDAPEYITKSVTPTRTESKIFVELRDKTKALYDAWKKEIDGERKKRFQVAILTLVMRLRMYSNSIYCNHKFTTEKVMKRCAKVDALINDLDNYIYSDPNNAVVVVSQFTSFLDVVSQCVTDILHGVTIYRFDGTLSLEEREQVISDFRKDKGPRVLLLSLMSGGVGLTLTESSTIVLCEPYFNRAVERQAEERVHRIGQKNKVKIIKYCMERSIELWMNKLKEKKQYVATNIGLASLDEQVKTFNMNDLSDLFKSIVFDVSKVKEEK